MYCNKCGVQILDNSLFCSRCGFSQDSVLPSHQQTSTLQESLLLKGLKCPNCRRPLTPEKGEVMVVCQYCGTTVLLSFKRWSMFPKHYILDIKMGLQSDALNVAKDRLNGTILNRHLYEKSELKSTELNYIPFWIIEAGYSAQYTYRRAETQQGSKGTRNHHTFILSGSDTGQILFPIVAVENERCSLELEKIPLYLEHKRLLTPRDLDSSVKFLNGTVSEESARMKGRVGVQQVVINKLKNSVRGYVSAGIRVDLGDVFLIHIPIWSLLFSYKSKRILIRIDAHTLKVLGEVRD